MNEKKIIAISEREFTIEVALIMAEILHKMPSTVENADEYAGKKVGEMFGDLHAKIFSDKYVTGKLPASCRQVKYKKCRRSKSNANGGKTKNTSIFYHETEDLSRGNEK